LNFLYLILIGIALYFLSDRLLDRIEKARGERFPSRDAVFFGIFGGSMVVAVLILNKVLGGP